jgi:hypothetical protein
MARSKHMGVGSILVFFLVIVALIPFLYSYFGGRGKFYAAFTDMGSPDLKNEVKIDQSISNSAMADKYDSRFGVCRQPAPFNGSPCPEGMFCDGARSECQPRFVA